MSVEPFQNNSFTKEFEIRKHPCLSPRTVEIQTGTSDVPEVSHDCFEAENSSLLPVFLSLIVSPSWEGAQCPSQISLQCLLQPHGHYTMLVCFVGLTGITLVLDH